MTACTFFTPLRALQLAVAAAALGLVPAASHSATMGLQNVLDTEANGDTLNVDIGVVSPEGNTDIGDINLGAFSNVVFRWTVQDSTLPGPSAGSLTLTTYVEPFLPIGVGAMTGNFVSRDVLNPLENVSIMMRWGDAEETTNNVPLQQGVLQGGISSIQTTFPQGGWDGRQELVFSWEGLDPTKQNQFAASIAAIPLPAAGWLLLTALGGLAFAGWRRNPGA